MLPRLIIVVSAPSGKQGKTGGKSVRNIARNGSHATERKELMFRGLPWQVWVKKRRKELGLTQAELAKRVSYSEDMISRVERGLYTPSLGLATLLAEILEVPPEECSEFVRVARLETPERKDKISHWRPPSLRIPGIPATPLIGRLGELDRVHQSLKQAGTKLITITGPPGVGKTRLAMTVAQNLEACYADGVFWVALAPLRDSHLVLNEVAQVLKIKESGNQPLLDALQVTLWEQQVLLVLDNCEQVQGMSSVIAGLLAAPGVRILATSRKRIRVRGEQQIPLAPLPVPSLTTPLIVEDLRAYPALTLFMDRARETSPDFALDTSNAAEVVQICVALDGLPLALELAAVRIHVLPPAAMLKRLHERLDWLVGGPEDLPDRHQTLLGALTWSYDLLGPSQQLLFKRLSVFAGGFTLAAAGAICSTFGDLDADLLSIVTELNEWNLLYRISELSAEPRFGMLETIHEYAARCLKVNEDAQLRRAHLAFYLALAEQTRAINAHASAEDCLLLLENEQANFRAALSWGLSAHGDLNAAGRLGAALGWFWEVRGFWQEGRYWLTSLLTQEAHLPDKLVAKLRYYAGRFAYLQGDYISAERFLKASLALGQEQNDVQTQIASLNTMGWIAYSQCDYRSAHHFYTQSLDLCQAIGDPLAIAKALSVLGGIASGLGDQITAESLLQQSLLLQREHRDQQGIAHSLNGLGLTMQRQDDLAQARQFLADSLEIFQALGDKLGIAMVSNNLGWLCLVAGDLDRGHAWLTGALELAREIDSAWITHQALCYMGWLAIEQGRPAEAAQHLHESLAMAQARGIKQAVILSRLGLARVALMTENPAQAAKHFQSAEQLRVEHDIVLPPFEGRVVAQLQQAVQAHLPLLARKSDVAYSINNVVAPVTPNKDAATSGSGNGHRS
jgi:predicted ATPase/transcriptional regulator with XRE-family HTH domain